jgi:hypothetical protein
MILRDGEAMMTRIVYRPETSIDIAWCSACKSMLNFAGLCRCRGFVPQPEFRTISLDEFRQKIRDAQETVSK